MFATSKNPTCPPRANSRISQSATAEQYELLPRRYKRLLYADANYFRLGNCATSVAQLDLSGGAEQRRCIGGDQCVGARPGQAGDAGGCRRCACGSACPVAYSVGSDADCV